ncbi:uncharacterized protein K02A2.6-like [Malaya genurostris]|uniref:uncharacterized protein K02A2.6-like n=1 Tax=Malaya genurostris TaxID=325434 RepID=UPI0026F38377|nr:uncharacterized protein K02A2.6-like [Malaya genurostris]
MNKTFSVRTDSEANEFIFGDGHKISKRAVSRAEAWALRVQAYDFTIKRIPGHLNVADALSRLIKRTQIDEPFDEENNTHLLYALDAGSMDITWQEMESTSELDDELRSIRMAIQTERWPENLRRFEAQKNELRTYGSMIFKADLIILPNVLRSKAVKSAHQGHIGCAAMKKIMREFFWWPGMSKDVETFVKKCETCLAMSRKNPPIPLSSRELPDGPWEILQIDFLAVPNCGSGDFLIVVDTYSRYLAVVEMRSTDARCTNSALCRIFYTWGLPLILQSDNGPPFQGIEFIKYWEEKGVKVRKSIPLSAQSNGAVERQNQGIIKALAAAKEDRINWKHALEKYVHVHNNVKPHSRLNITPFELLVGWKYRGIFPCLWENKSSDKIDRCDVRDKDAVSKLVSKKYADDHRGAKESEITAGDIVVMAIPKNSKTDRSFSKERYKVLTRHGAKLVIRRDRGVQYTRNIQDLKLAPENIDLDTPSLSQEDKSDDIEDLNINSHFTQETEGIFNDSLWDDQNQYPERKRRIIRKPAKFNDMFLYHVFQFKKCSEGDVWGNTA